MKKSLFAIAASALIATPAIAGPFSDNVTNDAYSSVNNGIPTANDDNDGIPDLYDAVNAVLGTSYTANEDLDNRFYEPDSVFTGQGSHSIALIGLTAGNSNTLGVYTDIGTGANQTAVLGPESGFGFTGDGTSGNPFQGATFDVTGDFGWYLDSNNATYYSEADMNDGGWDHMMTFEMSELNGQSLFIEVDGQLVDYTFQNAFLIGWEDLPYRNSGTLGDDDYDDMMYLVDFRPVDVPEPTTGVLFGAGLLALAGVRRRRK